MQFKVAPLVSLLFLSLVAADELKIVTTKEVACGKSLHFSLAGLKAGFLLTLILRAENSQG